MRSNPHTCDNPDTCEACECHGHEFEIEEAASPDPAVTCWVAVCVYCGATTDE